MISNINMVLRKMLITICNFQKTAYHHYGKNHLSILKLIYYSFIRINTFYVYENDLTRALPPHNLDEYYRIERPSLEKLNRIRHGMNLPREFYYDQIYKLRTFYLVLKSNELAKIYWVLFKGDFNRFLVLTDGVAELNYNTTLAKFRGDQLMAKMMAYISLDLQKQGFRKAVGVINEFNYPAIKSIEKAGFKRVATIKSLGPFNRRMKI